MFQPEPVTVVINEVVLSGLGLVRGEQVLEEIFVVEKDPIVATCVHEGLFAELLEVKLLSLVARGVSGCGFLVESQVCIL